MAPDRSLALKKIVDHHEVDPRERELPEGPVPERTSTPLRDDLYPLPYPSASLYSSLITTASGRHFPATDHRRPGPSLAAILAQFRPPLTRCQAQRSLSGPQGRNPEGRCRPRSCVAKQGLERYGDCNSPGSGAPNRATLLARIGNGPALPGRADLARPGAGGLFGRIPYDRKNLAAGWPYRLACCQSLNRVNPPDSRLPIVHSSTLAAYGPSRIRVRRRRRTVGLYLAPPRLVHREFSHALVVWQQRQSLQSCM